MNKLTEEQQDSLRSLRSRLHKDLKDAQSITMTFGDDNSLGHDFYFDVQLTIETAIDGLDGLLGDDSDA